MWQNYFSFFSRYFPTKVVVQNYDAPDASHIRVLYTELNDGMEKVISKVASSMINSGRVQCVHMLACRCSII
jgi:hypothetical protein